ncbi:MAG: hypothetical protein IPI67_28120 [Myxococcales bacterium]|nr:hypothetical protein [Myxococcales bacterium]
MKIRKSLEKILTISALPLLFALATVETGCLGHSGPSEIAQGQRYQSGDPTYDQFFEAVHELSLQMSTAPQAEGRLRMALGKELGVEPEEEDEPAPAVETAPTNMEGAPGATDATEAQLKQSAINAIPGASTVNAVSAQVDQAKQTVGQFKALFGGNAAEKPEPAKAAAAPAKKTIKAPSASLLAKAVKSRANKLGVEMKLTVDHGAFDSGEAKASMLSSGDNDEGQKLAKLVEKTAKEELQLAAKMRKVKSKLSKLATLGAALDANVDSTFRKSRAKMSEVRKNLEDAKALIELMDSRAADVDKQALLMVNKLEQAAAADITSPDKAETAVAKSDAKTEDKSRAKAAEQARAGKTTDTSKSKAKPKDKDKTGRANQSHAAAPATVLADFEP